MAKKNKDIEVRIEETSRKVAGETKEITQLFIGKKMIGELIPQGKLVEIFIDGNSKGTVKTQDAGIESVIREWNLQD